MKDLENFCSQAEKQRFHFRKKMVELNENKNSKVFLLPLVWPGTEDT